jgi:hypothetical protein
MLCNWLTFWYNVRYFNEFWMKGLMADGHDWEYTGEIHADHWHMRCTRCGSDAASEIGPDALVEEL